MRRTRLRPSRRFTRTVNADRLSDGLVPSGRSLEFTQGTLPDALQREHKLAEGRWGVLHVLEGEFLFVDLANGCEQSVVAPGSITIRPQAPHRVVLTGPLRCRIDFFREP